MRKRFVSGHNFSCAEKILFTWASAPVLLSSVDVVYTGPELLKPNHFLAGMNDVSQRFRVTRNPAPEARHYWAHAGRRGIRVNKQAEPQRGGISSFRHSVASRLMVSSIAALHASHKARVADAIVKFHRTRCFHVSSFHPKYGRFLSCIL